MGELYFKSMRMKDVLEHEDEENYYVSREVIISKCSDDQRKEVSFKLAEFEIRIPLSVCVSISNYDLFHAIILAKLLNKKIPLNKAKLIGGLMGQELTLVRPQLIVAEA